MLAGDRSEGVAEAKPRRSRGAISPASILSFWFNLISGFNYIPFNFKFESTKFLKIQKVCFCEYHFLKNLYTHFESKL